MSEAAFDAAQCELLSSRDNPRVRLLHQLAHLARERRKQGLTVLDGPHLLREALQRGFLPSEVFVSQQASQQDEIAALLDESIAATIPVTLLHDKLAPHVSPVDAPTGLVAVLPLPPAPPVVIPRASCVILNGVQEPGNLGTILRTVAAAGIEDVLLTPGCTQAWSPRALRAGMGGHFALRIAENVDVFPLLDAFRGEIIATWCGEGAVSLYDCDLRGPLAWLIGGEGQGLSAQLAARASRRVQIPLMAGIESLNVGAAVAICLFEQVRQQRT